MVAEHEDPVAQRRLGRAGPRHEVGVGGGGQVAGTLHAALAGQVAPVPEHEERQGCVRGSAGRSSSRADRMPCAGLPSQSRVADVARGGHGRPGGCAAPIASPRARPHRPGLLRLHARPRPGGHRDGAGLVAGRAARRGRAAAAVRRRPGLPRRALPGPRRHDRRDDGQRPARPRGARRGAGGRARRPAHGLRRGVAGERAAPARRRRARPRPDQHLGGRPAARRRRRAGRGQGRRRASGGSATNDAGAGMLAALGAGPASVLARGGLALASAADDALPGLADVVARLAGVEIVVATDDDTPLLGLQGTSAVEAPRKGASPELAQALEGALGHFTDVAGPVAAARPGRAAQRDAAPARPRGGRRGRRWPRLRPARARRAPGRRGRRGAARVRLRHRRGPQRPRRHRRGPGRLEHPARVGGRRGRRRHARDRAPDRARRGGVPGRPAGDDDPGPGRHYAVADSRAEVEAMVADPVPTLAARTARVARTWSPPR